MPIETLPTTLDDLRRLADAGELYAVLDACDTPAVPWKAGELGKRRAVSLYSGTAQEEYWSIAPYLFRVDGELLDWIRESLWTEPWGILAVSDKPLEALRRHFKKFLIVRSPDGEQWYFRFYDPRVLRSFLPTCDEEQMAELFGPIRSYAIPEEEGERLSALRWSRSAPTTPLPPAAPAAPAPDAPKPPQARIYW